MRITWGVALFAHLCSAVAPPQARWTDTVALPVDVKFDEQTHSAVKVAAPILDCAWSSPSSILLAGADGMLRHWDCASNQTVDVSPGQFSSAPCSF